METGSENVPASEIDALHAAVTEQAGEGTAPEVEPLETVDDPAGGAAPHSGPDQAFCEKIIALCLSRHARSVHNEFMRDLATACEASQAERIATMATMDVELQEAFSKHGARVLDKYGVAKFVSDEAVLIGSFLAYRWQLSEARSERDELLARLKPKASPIAAAVDDSLNGTEA